MTRKEELRNRAEELRFELFLDMHDRPGFDRGHLLPDVRKDWDVTWDEIILKVLQQVERAVLERVEQQAKRIQELEEWQKKLEEWQQIVIGAGTDQDTITRMAATEYTQVAIQSWKEKCEQQAKEIQALREALQDCLEQLKDDIQSVGPCEHDVNICVCGLKALALQAKEALKEVS